MRKLISLLALSFFGMIAFGQTIVSTVQEKKNVLIEDFTGIKCGFCPMGHLEAENLMENNEGRAFVISMHQGAYAVPGPGEPDLRCISYPF